MLKINTQRPDKIHVNNQEVNFVAVEQNETRSYLWGKAMNLSVDYDPSQAVVNVSRQQSPYEHADLVPLDNNDIIYYGDVIKIEILPTSSAYLYDYIEINDRTYTHTPISAACQTDMILKVFMNEGITWKTIFSGNLESPHQALSSLKTYSLTIDGLKADTETRVTGGLYKETNTLVEAFDSQPLPISLIYNSKEQTLELGGDNEIIASLQRPTPTLLNKAPYFVITKVEQFC